MVFCSVASDSLGEVQTTPTVAQATTTVSAAPPAPIANPDTFVLGQGTVRGTGVTSVLANDVSGDNKPSLLRAVQTRSTTHGNLAFNSDGSFTYTPGAGFEGVDQFSYEATEGTAASAPTTVTLLSYQASIVDKLYNQVLGRSADPQGLEYWTSQILAGASYGAVAQGIFESNERLDAIIGGGQLGTITYQGYYPQFLLRAPDPADLVLVNLDGTVYSYAATSVKGVHIRTHDGADTVSGFVNNVAVSTPLAIWGGNGNDTLTGGSGNDTLSAGTGTDVLDGGGGTNTLVETANVNFVLTNTSLVGPGVYTLEHLTVANLTGGAGNYTFDVSGWTGAGTLTGGGGTATVVATKNANMSLTAATLTSGDGMSLKLSGFKLASLTAGSGNDVIDASAFTGKVTLTGGTGNDILFGAKGASLLAAGSGNQVLVGGAGNDTLIGGSGRDLLIGGARVDSLVAGAGEDILIGDTSTYGSNTQSNLAALNAIMAEWDSADSYATRINDLLNGGGLNVVNGSAVLLNTSTVVSDKKANVLVGSTTASDWFFASTVDKVSNYNSATETKTKI
ncbi:MAG TPA: Ig-like domain-containing protein [Pirellulales bacterium]|jgi:Ca2+-binding RTX toxin-like protein|nr:Ig-like domain-containing protein [Pirellulales bacterium]